MVSDPVMQWVLTIAFSATGIFSMINLVLNHHLVTRVGDALHVAMSLGMVAMCWPWWNATPAVPQLVTFLFGTAWFLGLLAVQLRAQLTRAITVGHSAWHQGAHAIMMLAMVWMIVVMPPGSTPSGEAHHHHALAPWAALSGVAVTAGLLVFGVTFLIDAIVFIRARRNGRVDLGEALAGAVMSLGMVAMCWPMIAG